MKRIVIIISSGVALLAVVALLAWQLLTDWPTVPKAQGTCPTAPAEPGPDAGIHGPLDSLLRAYVIDGVVDYRCLAAHRDQLSRALDTYADTDAATLSRDEQLAFWINAYNAATLEVILRHYPQIDSIRELGGGLGPWKSVTFRLGGRDAITLDEIEHGILRKMNEPRIHFAIVCASKGCPPLRSEAFVASRLDAQLDDQARRLLSDPARGATFDRERNVLKVTKILEWFGDDFGADPAARIERIRPWLHDELRTVVPADVTLEYLDWDWSLNGQ
ncbi:MAG: DUF547 domain-containing protein [Planctomycetota bacterium]